MTVDRPFLDIFWSLPSIKEPERIDASKKLIAAIKKKSDNERNVYLKYTKERLVKGLKAYDNYARLGFHLALRELLKEFPEIEAIELMKLISQYIYKAKASTPIEKTSLKWASYLSADILLKCGKLQMLDNDSCLTVINSIIELKNSSVHAISALLLLSEMIKIIPKSLINALGELLKNMHISLMSTDVDSIGAMLLLLFAAQTRFKKSDDELSIKMMNYCSQQEVFSEIWPNLCDHLSNETSSPRLKIKLIKMIVHAVLNLDQHTALFMLRPEVFKVISVQLSNSNFKHFNEVCVLVREMINKVIQASSQPESSTDPTSSAHLSVNSLFSSLITHFPLIDFSTASGAPNFVQMMLEMGYKLIDLKNVTSFVNKLMNIYDHPEEPYLENIKSVRCFILFQLRLVLQNMIKLNTSSSFKLFKQILNFVLSISLKAKVFKPQQNNIPDKIFDTCWSVVFRTLDLLINQHHLTQNSEQAMVFDPLNEIMDIMKSASTHLESSDSIKKESHLPLVNEFICVIQKLKSPDNLDKCMLILGGVGSMYSLSLQSDDVLDLLNDLMECYKRRHDKKGSNSRNKNTENEPDWSAVLTDVILGFLSHPIHVLRTIVKQTFYQMIVNKVWSKCDQDEPNCVNLIEELLKTRSIKSQDQTDDLITFTNETNDNEEFKMVEVEEPMEVDNEQSDDSESDESTSSSDSDEEAVDEDSLERLRESVRQALGPAALDEDTEAKDFTDAEMFARDDALVNAFKANRLNVPQKKAAQQARSLGEFKMRCLDLIECIVQHESEPSLILPSLNLLIKLSNESQVCESKLSKNERKGNQNKKPRLDTKFVSRHGDMPSLNRLAEIARVSRQRSNATQTEFLNYLRQGDHLKKLKELVEFIMDISETSPHPLPNFVKCVTYVVQFIFRSVATFQGAADNEFSSIIMAHLTKLLDNVRKSGTHPIMFISFFNHCKMISAPASDLLVDRVSMVFDRLINSKDDETKGSKSHTNTQLFGLLTQLFKSNSTDCEDTDRQHLLELSERLLCQFANLIRVTSSKNEPQSATQTSCWYNTPSVSTALFELCLSCIKLNKKNVAMFNSEHITFLMNFPSNQKQIRQISRRFANCVIEYSRTNGDLIKLADKEERQKMKIERKRKRQEKRKEKTTTTTTADTDEKQASDISAKQMNKKTKIKKPKIDTTN